MYNSTVFSIFTEFTTITTIYFQNILITPKGDPVPINSHPHPLPQALTPNNPLSVSLDLPLLDASRKWNHTLCNLLHLASQTLCVVGFIHVVVCML